jgi:hypothetical protein
MARVSQVQGAWVGEGVEVEDGGGVGTVVVMISVSFSVNTPVNAM